MDERLRPWRIVSSEYRIDTKFLRLRVDRVELPSGVVVDEYYVRESHGFCVIFALTADDDVLLVRQYKHGAAQIVTELPAGMIDAGESPAAIRCSRSLPPIRAPRTPPATRPLRSFRPAVP